MRAEGRPLAVMLCLALLALPGCRLIDQTTFAPSPSKNPALLPVAPPIDKRAALLTIDEGSPVLAYRDLLRFAVQQASRRDPNVQFDVLAVVPGTGDAAAQAAAVGTTQKEAVVVMQEIGRDGVSPERIHLRAGVAASITRPQIRVYVR